MPTYVVLLNWTDEGIRAVKETIQRAADGAAVLPGEFGGTIGSRGHLRATTHRAYDREETSGIVQRLG